MPRLDASRNRFGTRDHKDHTRVPLAEVKCLVGARSARDGFAAVERACRPDWAQLIAENVPELMSKDLVILPGQDDASGILTTVRSLPDRLA